MNIDMDVMRIDFNRCGNFSEVLKWYVAYTEERETLHDITRENMGVATEISASGDSIMFQLEKEIEKDKNAQDVDSILYAYFSLLKVRVRLNYMLYLCLNPTIRMPDVQTQFEEYIPTDKYMHNLLKPLLN